METILVSLVSLALIIVSFVSLEINTLQSTNKIANSLKQMEAQSGEVIRTNIIALPPSIYSGGAIDLTVKNDGQTNLSDFAKWDVIAQYQTGEFSYLTYTPTYPPGNNGQWTVKGIYTTGGTPETFDPGILDPGEQMVVSIALDRNLSSGQSCEITVSTPNGVKSQTQITAE
jgi:hypothetical protein